MMNVNAGNTRQSSNIRIVQGNPRKCRQGRTPNIIAQYENTLQITDALRQRRANAANRRSVNTRFTADIGANRRARANTRFTLRVDTKDPKNVMEERREFWIPDEKPSALEPIVDKLIQYKKLLIIAIAALIMIIGLTCFLSDGSAEASEFDTATDAAVIQVASMDALNIGDDAD